MAKEAGGCAQQGRCSRRQQRGAGWTSGVALALLLATGLARASAQQLTAAVPAEAEAAGEAGGSLPDAPSAAADGAANLLQPGQPAVPIREAGRFDKFIEAGEAAPRLSFGDKVVLGMRASVSPFTAVGWVTAAGYEQALNGAPNYGQTGKGFVQRLGAAAARAASEDIFTDAVLAPALHQDPRYYQLGRGHNPAVRAVYAISRVFITRTDGGRETLNLSLLGGNLAGSAMTQAYYPPINRGFTQVSEIYGGSLGGSALGFVLTEFFSQTAEALGLKHH